MAKQIIVETGFGHIAKPQRIVLDRDGKVPAGAILQINNAVERIANAINGALSLGDGSQGARAGNLDAQFLEFTTPSTPNEEFELFHGLRRNAAGYLVVRRNAAAILYDSSIGSWGPESVFLKCNTASVLFKIMVF